MDGNFVLMDIAAAQLAFDRLGRVDRVGRPADDGRGSAPDTARSMPRSRRRACRRPHRAAARAARRAGRADARGVSSQPRGAVVGRADRRAVPRLQHRDDLGHRAARGDRHAARARRHAAAGAGAVSGRGRGRSGSPARSSGIGLGRVLADAAVGLTASTVSTLYIAAAAAPPSAWRRGTSRWRSRSACRCRCSRPHCRRVKRSRVPPIGRDARRATRWNHACGCAAALVVPAAVLRWRYGLARLGAGRWPAALRLPVVVRDHHRRLAARAGDHLRPRAGAARRRLRRLLGVEGCSRTPTSRRRSRACRSRSRRSRSACR